MGITETSTLLAHHETQDAEPRKNSAWRLLNEHHSVNTDNDEDDSNNNDYDVITWQPQSHVESFLEWKRGRPSGRQKGKRQKKGEGTGSHSTAS